jgi:uncharacterized iron-regulated membrane protein
MRLDLLRYRWVAGFLLLFSIAAHSGSAPQERVQARIAVDSARRLVYEAVSVHNPGAAVSQVGDEYGPEFYNFDATWPNTTGSPMIGYFSVNPWTAEVWDDHSCRRLVSPRLKKLQDRIRRESGIQGAVDAKFREKKPLCIGPHDR